MEPTGGAQSAVAAYLPTKSACRARHQRLSLRREAPINRIMDMNLRNKEQQIRHYMVGVVHGHFGNRA